MKRAPTPASGRLPEQTITTGRTSEEAAFIGERRQNVVKLRRSLRSPEENIAVSPNSARPEHCGAGENGLQLFAFLPHWYYDKGQMDGQL